MSLAAELISFFRAWERDRAPWPDGRFEELALRAFEHQYGSNAPYRRYCVARDRTPANVARWENVPPVPTAAFRRVRLASELVVPPPAFGDTPRETSVPLEFLTSGTTRGPGRRGRHVVPDPGLYRASLEAGFRRFVLGDRDAMRIGSLLPPFDRDAPSSLSWMGAAVLERFGLPGSRRVAGADGIDWSAAATFVGRACEEETPVCLLATTLAADEWTRRLVAEELRIALPDGSRLMDTGGTKGREGLRREDVVDRLEATLGLPPTAIVNEFGMTELCSQRYASAGEPHRGPPWLRTRALDPVSLEEVPPGEEGVLCHFDLANLGSVCAVLTEDLGRVRDGALAWIGRSPGAPPRGCSLATAEMLEAQP